MSSEPPREPPRKPLSKPPGLTSLNLGIIQDIVPSSAAAISPSYGCESASAITPITSSSSISEMGAITPTSGGKYSIAEDNSPFSPSRFFPSKKGRMTSGGTVSSRTVTEREPSRVTYSSSYSYFPTLFRSKPGSESTDCIKESKKSDKKKEAKEKVECRFTILNFSEDAFTPRDYPPGHRGFLEVYAERFGFSQRLRSILGINSFAEVASIELFSSKMAELDLETKVLVSISSIIRIASKMRGEIHKKLLDNLCLYDRSMSYWLAQNDAAMNAYQHYMRNIFFEDKTSTIILDFFYSIPAYGSLNDEIRDVLLPGKYQTVYEKLSDALEEYRATFSLELSVSGLKEAVTINEEIVEKFRKEREIASPEDDIALKELEWALKEMEREIQEKSEALNEHLRHSQQFTQDTPVKNRFFNKFLQLRNEEIYNDSKVADKKLEDFPVWNKESFCEKSSLKICLYFFRALCNQHPKFYDMCSGEKLSDIYVNQKFIPKWRKIKGTEKFLHLMQEQKENYNTGLLEIILYKTLEYISENAQIPIDYSSVISKALAKAAAKFPELVGMSLHHYDESFFKEVMQVAFKYIIESSEPYLEPIQQKSGPAPRM